jgi:hypothetical protein
VADLRSARLYQQCVEHYNSQRRHLAIGGGLAALLRSYTTGFVIDEQAFLELEGTGEWDSLIQQIAASGHRRPAGVESPVAVTGQYPTRSSASQKSSRIWLRGYCVPSR